MSSTTQFFNDEHNKNELSLNFDEKLSIQALSNEPLFSYAKIYMSKFVLSGIKYSLEAFKDPKQQFNSLLLMDQFFSVTFGGPGLQTELKFFKKNQLR
jgi:hypothetical protein